MQLVHSFVDALGGQKIHGFRFVAIGDELTVLVFGGKLLRLCRLTESSSVRRFIVHSRSLLYVIV
jgi:hypothetical protein